MVEMVRGVRTHDWRHRVAPIYLPNLVEGLFSEVRTRRWGSPRRLGGSPPLRCSAPRVWPRSHAVGLARALGPVHRQVRRAQQLFGPLLGPAGYAAPRARPRPAPPG